VDVTAQQFEGCPHRRTMDEPFRALADELGKGIRYRMMTSPRGRRRAVVPWHADIASRPAHGHLVEPLWRVAGLRTENLLSGHGLAHPAASSVAFQPGHRGRAPHPALDRTIGRSRPVSTCSRSSPDPASRSSTSTSPVPARSSTPPRPPVRDGILDYVLVVAHKPTSKLLGPAAVAAAALAAGTALYRGLVTGRLSLDLGVGRRTRALGPLSVDIAAPPEAVFATSAAPYAVRRTPAARRHG
jgi:hypothetical protein